MRSFSSTSFASDDSALLARAAAAVAKHPQALFSDFQWYMFAAQDTVWFTAFSRQIYTREMLLSDVADMVGLAPQLTHGFVGARPGQPLARAMLEEVVSIAEVDSFEGYPDKWLSTNTDLFDRDDLPLFRVGVVNLKGGPDAQGRASLVMVRSSHAVLEGSDSALLTRTQSAAHGLMSDQSKEVTFRAKLSGMFEGWFSASLYLIFGYLLAPPEQPWGFKTLAFKRQRMRALANKLGVGQRTLMFSLVLYALNGSEGRLGKTPIPAAYTSLAGERNEADDEFMRLRAITTKFKPEADFATFVRGVQAELDRSDAKDHTRMQVAMRSTFNALRGLNRLIPAMPTRRFWRFNGGIKIGLTLIPPHRTYGKLTEDVLEPIYCGAWHPNTNAVTFVPAREYVTLTFSMEKVLVDHVGEVEALFDRLEAELR